MDLVTESTYDDSVFEHDTNSPDTTKQTPRKGDARDTNVTKAEHSDGRVTKEMEDSKDFNGADDTTLPRLDSTANTTILENKSEVERNDNTVLQTNETASNKTASQNLTMESIDDGKYIGDKHDERKRDQTRNIERQGASTRINDKRINIVEALANNEKPVEKISKSHRKDLNNQNQSNLPPARLGRQESDMTSLKSMRSSEIESKQFVNSDRFFYHSGFPSLIANLGPNAMNRISKVKRQKQMSPSKRPEVFKETDEANRLSKTHHKKQYAAFSLSMKRKNESTWTRIEAVAKEKMELYERYVIDMTIKLKRQREQINRRSQELLESLAKIEEKSSGRTEVTENQI